jgi:hypothetical protein
MTPLRNDLRDRAYASINIAILSLIAKYIFCIIETFVIKIWEGVLYIHIRKYKQNNVPMFQKLFLQILSSM